MVPSYTELGESERQRIDSQLQAAARFMAEYSPADEGSPLALRSLDRAFAAWMALGITDTQAINEAINAVGVAFGSLLVRRGGFSWVLASDEYGTGLAVVALRGTADFLVCPAIFVAKHGERRQAGVLEMLFHDIVTELRSVTAKLSQGGSWTGPAALPDEGDSVLLPSTSYRRGRFGALHRGALQLYAVVWMKGTV
jgi:hypothetical protein